MTLYELRERIHSYLLEYMSIDPLGGNPYWENDSHMLADDIMKYITEYLEGLK